MVCERKVAIQTLFREHSFISMRSITIPISIGQEISAKIALFKHSLPARLACLSDNS